MKPTITLPTYAFFIFDMFGDRAKVLALITSMDMVNRTLVFEFCESEKPNKSIKFEEGGAHSVISTEFAYILHDCHISYAAYDITQKQNILYQLKAKKIQDVTNMTEEERKRWRQNIGFDFFLVEGAHSSKTIK